MKTLDVSGYSYQNEKELNIIHSVLLPKVLEILSNLKSNLNGEQRIFDLGCGNGSVANVLEQHGWHVTGVDPSIEGIKLANDNFPNLKLYNGSTYDNLMKKYGQFPALLSLEVIEHVYSPRDYAKKIFDLLNPGGIAIISTPYHGYWKNFILAISGRMDDHFHALWDHGHIKFWSIKTLSKLMYEAGFIDICFKRVGRIPPIAKSMIVTARKPLR
jgi:2-polyprenyl-6-hydroxyphenyl methylase/3-demethylubiquinone-9 3-methyltransferase